MRPLPVSVEPQLRRRDPGGPAQSHPGLRYLHERSTPGNTGGCRSQITGEWSASLKREIGSSLPATGDSGAIVRGAITIRVSNTTAASSRCHERSKCLQCALSQGSLPGGVMLFASDK